MLNNEKDLVTRLLKQNIVTLCKETISYDTQLEIDGIICISTGNESQQIVVKVHHFFQKLNQGSKPEHHRNTTDNGVFEPKVSDNIWEERKHEKRYPIVNGQDHTSDRSRDEYFQNTPPCIKPESKAEIVLSSSDRKHKSPTFINTGLKYNGFDQGIWKNSNKNNSLQIPKTITSLEQDEASLLESEKMASTESGSGSDTMDYDDECHDNEPTVDRKDNLSNPHIISFHENGDVISEIPGQSPVKVLPNDMINNAFDTKPPSRKHASPDENSMIECKLGKNCNTDEDLSKVPIRQVSDIPCKRCGIILSDGPAFEQHNTDVHSVYTCRVCFNTFTCRNNMKRHMRLHTGFRPYTCKLCSESFTRKDDIKRHLIRHSFDKPFRCNVCRKGYMDRKTVKNHIRKEHNSKIIHICQTCGETFDNSAKFHDHKKNHPELKMFQCSLCKFTGSNLLTHNKHQLIHEVKKDYRCDPCDLIFGDPFRYTTHLRKHRTDPNFISYRCCFCNLKLSSYDLFLRHEHTHDQSEQFTCYVCMKQFQTDAALKDHKRSHPTYNNQNDTTSSGLLLPNIVGTPMMVQQPIFPSFMSSLSSGIKQEQTNNNIDETTEIKTTVRNMDVESNMNNTDDIESILKYRDDTIEVKVEAEENFDTTGNTQNDYWCAECQHGFATEDHLTEHIALAHETTSNHEDGVESNWNKLDNNEPSTHIENKEYLPKAEQSEMSGNEDSFDELEENDNPSCSPNSIRYTPVPIFSTKHNLKRAYARQDSKFVDNGNDTPQVSPDSMRVPLEINQDGDQNESLLETQEYYDSSQMDRCFERWSGKKNYHAQNQFMCDICFMNFSDFEAFDLHSSNVHRKFVCHFCGKGFTSRPNRDRHVRYHTGEKPFKCEVCHQSFVRGDDLRYHRTSKHPDVKPYTCTICGMSFPWAKDLERHTKTHGIG